MQRPLRHHRHRRPRRRRPSPLVRKPSMPPSHSRSNDSSTDDVIDFDKPDEVRPQGIFVVVSVQVENVGRSPQTYSADYQRLVDSEGREFSPDMRAMTTEDYDTADRIAINPGNAALSVLTFDVPNGTQPNQYVLLLHASPYSPGVTLSIPPPPPPPTFAPTADDDQRFLQKLASDNPAYPPYGAITDLDRQPHASDQRRPRRLSYLSPEATHDC